MQVGKRYFGSFSNRLSLRITAIVLLMMTLMGVGMVSWSLYVTNIFNKNYFQVLMDVTNETIENELTGVEVATTYAARDMERHLSSPDDVFKTLKQNIAAVPDMVAILGFFSAFEPYYYPQEGRLFEPYVMKVDSQIVSKRGGNTRYLTSEWYQNGLNAGSLYWSQPYLSTTLKGQILCSCIVPIHDREGHKVGVSGADISLNWLRKWLKQKDVEMNSRGVTRYLPGKAQRKDFWAYSFIIGNDGSFISHPDSTRILTDNFFTSLTDEDDTKRQLLIIDMLGDRSGMAEARLDGVDVLLFYTPLKRTNWTMGIVVPKMIYTTVSLLIYAVLVFFILLALLSIYFFGRHIIKRSSRPLQDLAISAGEVAKGHFDVPLPVIRQHDEIRHLRDAFSDMQQSLAQYVERLKTSVAEKTAYENEMNLAWNIQKSMIPDQFPPFPERTDIDIYGTMHPAKSVGGDLFDFTLRGDRLFFCIGDVCGKGIPAALVMAVTRSLFRSYVAAEHNPERMVMHINAAMCDGNKNNMFVTMFIGELDLKTGQLVYCNAGHEPPLLFGETLVRLPADRQLPVGIFEDVEYKSREMQLAPRHSLLLFTDGLSEAMNGDGTLFGIERIMQAAQRLEDSDQTGPQQIVEGMTAAVHDYVGDAVQNDDLTLLAIKYMP